MTITKATIDEPGSFWLAMTGPEGEQETAIFTSTEEVTLVGHNAAARTKKAKKTTKKTPKATKANKEPKSKKEPKKAAKKNVAKPEPKPEPAPPGKMSATAAAHAVLVKAKKGMTCPEMIAAMAEQGLWTSPNGKTPAATLYSAIIREIRDKGQDSRFTKSSRGFEAA